MTTSNHRINGMANAFMKCLEGGIIEKMLANQNNSANI